mmetsp:Transcript_15174/g.41982  ORF Transcript_15174/g.41982 Transcript_15174/m.41982 type:complete len:82 (+) Transcript_15174:2626-2871(+)
MEGCASFVVEERLSALFLLIGTLDGAAAAGVPNGDVIFDRLNIRTCFDGKLLTMDPKISQSFQSGDRYSDLGWQPQCELST